MDSNNSGTSKTKFVKVNRDQNAFEQWYEHGHGKKFYSHLPVYKEIKQPYINVHTNIHEALDILNKDWQQDPELHSEILNKFTTVEEETSNLLKYIDQMAIEKQRFESTAAEDSGEVDLF